MVSVAPMIAPTMGGILADTLGWRSIFNVIRSVSMGCLMMPLITWGTSRVDKKYVADATALLSSLRTISGSIGSAAFVGIMSAAAARSASVYGETANMYGMKTAFFGMTVSSVILVVMSVFTVKRKTTSRP
ncbi:MAG: hypothetical protein LIO96_00530 [Lachnospiraceae bacterium]|nr:hypothetical protein [Lachnospiraceae bacterium]